MFLLFGLAESGVEAAARAIHAVGAALAPDADTSVGHFAISRRLERLATEINADFGVAQVPLGPLLLPNCSFEDTRQRIAARLEARLDAAASEWTETITGDRSKPLVVVAGAMSAFPAFWLDAIKRAGAGPRAVLLHRNPLAIAQLARVERSRKPRTTIYQWHNLALDVLDADRMGLTLLPSPGFDLDALGLRSREGTSVQMPPRSPEDDAEPASQSILSEQSRDLLRLLNNWRTLAPRDRRISVAKLRRRFDDSVTLTGAARIASLINDEDETTAPQPAIRRVQDREPLLFHYHIFKNAGTSVDRMLKANFGDRWAEREFSEGSLPHRRADVHAYLNQRPDLLALSSHTAPLPEPELAHRAVFPILFVRHPVLRVRSAYRFERQQVATTRGAVLAKTTDFRGYVTAFLDDPKARQIRNFQTIRFAAGTPGAHARELPRALETLARLPFVGLVEAYDASVERLGEIVRSYYPEFRAIVVHENASAADGLRSIEEELAVVRDELGDAIYERLVDENRSDLEIFQKVRTSYDV